MYTRPDITTLNGAYHNATLWMQWVGSGTPWILWDPKLDILLVNLKIEVQVCFIGETMWH
jgi:hypothetical protein